MRGALGALGAGRHVVAVRVGAALCGALEAASRALHRPHPAGCPPHALLRAVLARVVGALAWRRVAPAPCHRRCAPWCAALATTFPPRPDETRDPPQGTCVR